MANKNINLAELEFDEIKQNLKTFLQGQSQFSDYDFEGSNMAILLDVLAYNTHYNAMYMNMAVNEVFLDSASRRNSLVSIAKNVGYIPRSSVCATANINFIVTGVPNVVGTGSPPPQLTVEENTEFYGTKDSVRYNFYVTTPKTVNYNATLGQYSFTNITVREGVRLTTQFAYTTQNNFILPNTGVDASTIRVRVQDSPSSVLFTSYTLASTLGDITQDSTVFFIKELDDGYHQIYFGDNVVGKQLSVGNVITVDYFVSNGEAPNGIASLQYGGSSFQGGTVSSITLNDTPVAGGRDPETTEEIRFNAPNMYAAQNRIVTALDYETLLLNKVPSISAVSVWGGETMSPPMYGKVFISARTTTGRSLTFAEQQAIIDDVIDKYKVVTIIPEFVSPQFIDVEIDVAVYYDPTQTTQTLDQIRSLIIAEISAYNTNELQKFNRILRHSTISRIIESVDPSIISTVPRMRMYRGFAPVYDVATNYTITVGNPFARGTIITDSFYVADTDSLAYIDDDGDGNLRLYTLISGIRVDIKNVGTVDYQGGVLNIKDLTVTQSTSAQIEIAIEPEAADIASVYNQIVTVDMSRLKVNMIVDNTANGRALVGSRFQFTSNRI